ncbi:MAG: SpoIIE family protein phosphatase [Melioribacteraceae bacterium]|nr:SpoIIE family protein phosphatase [Melioribacteraceae bacterium]MCF8353021.1 SpoIIE family protein phosphatase [Melioribacteraceae bacterium]MCF8392912.1 SpoIIE family protein phosphatase [Melioribacteraceae bacterium]MCF8417794.1 SpoIIE family protein phosphatase [Melioribacteraceae bacterium]
MKSKNVPVFGFILILSLLLVIYFYPRSSPFAGISITKNASEMNKEAVSKLTELGIINGEGSITNSSLKYNSRLLKYLNEEFGIEGTNKLTSELPVYYWELSWNAESPDDPDVIPESIFAPHIKAKFDLNGNFLSMEADLSSRKNLARVNEVNALETARDFLRNYTKYGNAVQTDEKYEFNKRDSSFTISVRTGAKTDVLVEREPGDTVKIRRHEIYFVHQDSVINKNIEIKIEVSGEYVAGYQSQYNLGDIKDDKELLSIFQQIGIIFIIIIVIFMIIVGVKKFRAYEIGFKLGAIVAVLSSLSVAAEIYSSMPSTFRFEFLIGLILGPLFIGAGIFLIWIISEAIGRENHDTSFIPFDVMLKGYLLDSHIGRALFTGIASGTGILAFTLIFTYLIDSMTAVYLPPVKNGDDILNLSGLVFSIFSKTFYSEIFTYSILYVFIFSYIKMRIKKLPYVILFVALIAALITSGSLKLEYYGFINSFIVSIIVVMLIVKFDFLAGFAAIFTSAFWGTAFSLFYMPNESIVFSGYVLSGFFIIVLIYSLISIFTKDSIDDYNAIKPSFVKHITERQRLQGEIAIAHDVQMSFLPKENPEITGLDIVAKCKPANEVGGDYYDFIQKSPSNIAVVIGDVSGKGTKAAFYMTLTKGFLKAIAKLFDSPAVILSKMNDMFYENVSRGNFISMLYGIFELDRKVLHYARAGHNPLLVRKASTGKVELLKSKGIALGLEKGEIFTKTIENNTITIEEDDLVIFYTDGFTEAMNKKREEFGESRMINFIENNYSLTAKEILDKLFIDVEKFMGRAEQHDDMTMVVIKIKKLH